MDRAVMKGEIVLAGVTNFYYTFIYYLLIAFILSRLWPEKAPRGLVLEARGIISQSATLNVE